MAAPMLDPSRPAVEPTRPAVEPSRPAVEPTRPAVEPSRPAVEPLTALLLCGDASVPCDVLLRTVADAGIEVVAHERRWSEAVHLAAELAPDVAVVDLAVAGSAGVRIVSVLRSALPGCEVVVVTPLPELDAAAREAGALEVVRPEDLRPLTSALRRLASEPPCRTGD